MAPIVGRFGSSRGGRDGAIAQLGERVLRNDEVGGSIPPGSTTLRLWLRVAQPRKKAKRARRSPLGRRRAGGDGGYHLTLHWNVYCFRLRAAQPRSRR